MNRYTAVVFLSPLLKISRNNYLSGEDVKESEKTLRVNNINWKTENDYPKWCEQQKHEPVTADINRVTGLSNIEKKITAFPIMRRTPMEAMNFIVELQKELNQ